MKKMRMCFPREKTFEDGFKESVLDCKANENELHPSCQTSMMQYLLWEMGCFSMSKSSANSQLIQSDLFMRMRTDILHTFGIDATWQQSGVLFATLAEGFT